MACWSRRSVKPALNASCSRQAFLRLSIMSVVALLMGACRAGGEDDASPPRSAGPQAKRRTPDAASIASGVVTARPTLTAPTGKVREGLQPLGIDGDEDAFVYVPANYSHAIPAPLVVLFHGAGGNAMAGIAPLLGDADAAGLLLMSTSSVRATWDIIASRSFGDDIERLDRALHHTFERFAVDPRRIAAGGFSDGASYALSVGLTNGNLFSAILAFSPGFIAPGDLRGQPRVFISHGTQDAVLPIDQTSRRIVPELNDAGYAVTYIEFDGPHTIPDDIVVEALDWWLNG